MILSYRMNNEGIYYNEGILTNKRDGILTIPVCLTYLGFNQLFLFYDDFVIIFFYIETNFFALCFLTLFWTQRNNYNLEIWLNYTPLLTFLPHT